MYIYSVHHFDNEPLQMDLSKMTDYIKQLASTERSKKPPPKGFEPPEVWQATQEADFSKISSDLKKHITKLDNDARDNPDSKLAKPKIKMPSRENERGNFYK